MYSSKTLLAAAALAVVTAAGGSMANAAPWEHRYHDPVVRHERHEIRRIIARERLHEVLRRYHYRHFGEPHFVRGHYVVRVVNRFGRPVYVEVNPYTGVFIGEFRL